LTGFLCACVALTAGRTQRADTAAPPNVVFVIGEDEYHTWETLPAFARTELMPRGVHCTIILQDPKRKNHFPGIVRALRSADLVVLSVRRRLPPRAELDALREYLDSGKPLVGIRTACHAFSPSMNATPQNSPHTSEKDSWVEFDPQVLGGHYIGHWGDSPTTTISAPNGAGASPILNQVDVSALVGNGSLYRVKPLDPTCRAILMGKIPGKDAEPVAWTREYGSRHARVFYTSLGHPADFAEPGFRRMLVNAIAWALRRDLSVHRANGAR
jgi:type 1 glutamine amidotransferase